MRKKNVQKDKEKYYKSFLYIFYKISFLIHFQKKDKKETTTFN